MCDDNLGVVVIVAKDIKHRLAATITFDGTPCGSSDAASIGRALLAVTSAGRDNVADFRRPSVSLLSGQISRQKSRDECFSGNNLAINCWSTMYAEAAARASPSFQYAETLFTAAA